MHFQLFQVSFQLAVLPTVYMPVLFFSLSHFWLFVFLYVVLVLFGVVCILIFFNLDCIPEDHFVIIVNNTIINVIIIITIIIVINNNNNNSIDIFLAWKQVTGVNELRE